MLPFNVSISQHLPLNELSRVNRVYSVHCPDRAEKPVRWEQRRDEKKEEEVARQSATWGEQTAVLA